MLTDVTVQLLDRKSGTRIVRGSFQVISKELLAGKTVSLVADSVDGRRLSLQISAEVLEDIAAPPEAAGMEKRIELAESAARIHSGAP